jgi:acetyltransferase-like isoleucine patch superfamily enzyme
MISLVQTAIQKRNTSFKFAESVSASDLLSFVWINSSSLLRGLQCVLMFRNPKFMLRGRRNRLQFLHKIKWGKFLKLGDNVTLSGLGSEGLTLGNSVGIGSHSSVIVSTSLSDPGSFIRIGDHVGIGEFAYLGGAGGLEIGDECIVGQYFSCHPENHNFSDKTVSIRHQGVSRQGIKIGRNCWIGSKVTILDGSNVGDNCVIAAGAVVRGDFPENVVIGGIPARILKTI